MRNISLHGSISFNCIRGFNLNVLYNSSVRGGSGFQLLLDISSFVVDIVTALFIYYSFFQGIHVSTAG